MSIPLEVDSGGIEGGAPPLRPRLRSPLRSRLRSPPPPCVLTLRSLRSPLHPHLPRLRSPPPFVLPFEAFEAPMIVIAPMVQANKATVILQELSPE